MIVKAVTLENFRRYRNPTTIEFGKLTAFIGKNDVGKSTILEALDIFFETQNTKIDRGDACANGDRSNVRITVTFSDLPEQLNIDAGAETTLRAEHLLNAQGDLEITKTFDCTKTTLTPKVTARAIHPSAKPVAGLIAKKVTDLRKLVVEQGLEANCQQNNKPSMRQALYEAADDLALVEQDVLLKDEDAKHIWEAIKRHFPVFALFRSDRASSDQDPEVQDPMKLAIKSAIAELNDDLAEITAKVERFARDTADRTIEQLKSSFPDLEVASVLTPQFRTPKWDSVFKLDLESDDQIPLNKRGSGIRRLILLSFFQAEAARKQTERNNQAVDNRVPVVYAIEEPETSQHPDSQERIIDALVQLAKSGDQVILTTHVPGLAGLLPVESLRFIDSEPTGSEVRVQNGSPEVYEAIAGALGVLPDAAEKPNVKVAVAVEGPTDIDALISFGQTLAASGDIQHFSPDSVFWTIGGGETLKDWVERRYLDRIGVPQVFLFDSDLTSPNLPIAASKQRRIDELNERANCCAFISKKRTIENYAHPAAIERLSGGRISIEEGVNWDFGNITLAFKSAFEAAKQAHGANLAFEPANHNGERLGLGTRETNCKKILTSFVMRNMSKDEIFERGAYADEEGKQRNEIIEWLDAICCYCAPPVEPRVRVL